MQSERGTLSITAIVYIGCAAALLGTGGWFTYRWIEAELITARNERDAAQKAAAIYEEVANDIRKDVSASDAIAKRNAEALAAERNSFAAFKAGLEAAAKADPAVAVLTVTSVPDAVRRLRRIDAGCAGDLSVPCTKGSAVPNPNPADAGRNSRGTIGGG